MAITAPDYNAVQTTGNTGTVVNSITPTAVSGMTNGKTRAFVVVGHTHNMGTTPAGWTAVFTNLSLALTGTLGSAAGPRLVSLYYRDKDSGWSSIPAFSMVSALNGSMALASYGLDKDDDTSLTAYTWNTPTWTATGGVDTTSNTAFASGSTSGMATHVGGMLMAAVVNNTGATYTPSTMTHTGTTVTLSERGDAGTTTGFDVGMSYLTGIPSASSGASNAFTASGTHSVATRAGVVFFEQTQTATARTAGSAISGLTDDFPGNVGDPPDPAKWVGGPVASGATLGDQLVIGDSGATLSLNSWNITSDAIYWQFPDGTLNPTLGIPADPYDGSILGGICRGDVGSSTATAVLTFIGVGIAEDGLGGFDAGAIGAGMAGGTRTHTPGDWYRVREASGTIYIDYSANGTSWTNLDSTTTMPENKQRVTAFFAETGTLGGFGLIDNVNVAAAGGPAGSMFFSQH